MPGQKIKIKFAPKRRKTVESDFYLRTKIICLGSSKHPIWSEKWATRKLWQNGRVKCVFSAPSKRFANTNQTHYVNNERRRRRRVEWGRCVIYLFGVIENDLLVESVRSLGPGPPVAAGPSAQTAAHSEPQFANAIIIIIILPSTGG